MKTYSEFRPTQFDVKGLNLPDQQNWYVVLGQNRDSEAWARSNFRSALSMLGGESEDVEVHRFGHWACGWLEIIIVRPDSPAETIARKIEASLEDYAILDEDDASAEEYEEACEVWRASDVADRLHLIERCGADPRVSIFAARRDELPYGIYASDVIQP